MAEAVMPLRMQLRWQLVIAVLVLVLGSACEESESGSDASVREDSGVQVPGDGDGDERDAQVGDGDAGDGDGDAGEPTDFPTTPSELDAFALGGSCPELASEGTAHAENVIVDETWTAADSPHRIDSNIRISADVILEPCARVLLGGGVTLQVGGTQEGEGGTLTALGEADEPVIFASASAGERWGSLRVENNGSVDLSFTALLDGGDVDAAQNGGGALLATGANDGTHTENVRVRGVLIQGSGGYGVNLRVGGSFTADSDALVVRDCGGTDAPEPVWIDTPGVGTLPAGDYSGNLLDEIAVDARLAVREDEAFRERGVPYRVQGALVVTPGSSDAVATLTLEAGVTLKLDDRIALGDGGIAAPLLTRIEAVGTASQPIVLTSSSASPAAGDWTGVIFDGLAPTGNRFEHVEIEYAGGDSQTSSFGCGPNDNDAAVIILNDRPEEAFIRNCTFRDNAGETSIVSGWVADEPLDLVTTNTFERTGGSEGTGCLQSRWRSTDTSYCPEGDGPFCAPEP